MSGLKLGRLNKLEAGLLVVLLVLLYLIAAPMFWARPESTSSLNDIDGPDYVYQGLGGIAPGWLVPALDLLPSIGVRDFRGDRTYQPPAVSFKEFSRFEDALMPEQSPK